MQQDLSNTASDSVNDPNLVLDAESTPKDVYKMAGNIMAMLRTPLDEQRGHQWHIASQGHLGEEDCGLWFH